MEGLSAPISVTGAERRPTPGLAAGTAVFSVLFCTLGLAVLRCTRPLEARRHDCLMLGSSKMTARLIGIFGALLLFTGLVLGSVPWLLGVSSDSEGKAAAMIHCTLVLACWLADRYLSEEVADPLHSCGCAVVWFGSTLIEWAGPRAHDSMMTGLAGQIAGCDGGFRSPFLVYAPLWLTAISFGTAILCLGDEGCSPVNESGSDGESGRWCSLPPPVQRKRFELRRTALPILYGFALSMSGFVFASGVQRDVVGWVVFGAILLAIAVICAWQWLWCLDLPLGLWALLSQNITTLLRLVQGHLVFRDFRWDPESELGLLIVWKRPGVWLFLLGFFLVVAVVVLFLSTPLEDEESPTLSRIARGEEHLPLAGSMALHSKRTQQLIHVQVAQWTLFALCVVFCYLGMTRPLIGANYETPALTWVQGPAAAAAQPSLNRTKAAHAFHEHSTSGESYLELIPSLYDKRLPCSAMVIAFNTVIRTPMQIVTFVAVMLRPRFMPRSLLQSLQMTFIVNQAPGWFVGPMVLMLLVSFVDVTGPGHSLFEANFGSGFWHFLLFSFFSVLIACTFQAFPETGAFGPTASPCSSGCRTPVRLDVHANSMTTKATEDEADSDSSEASASEVTSGRCFSKLNGILLGLGYLGLLAIIAEAMHLGLSRPFLNFEYRISDVIVKKAAPSVLELWYGIGNVSWILQVFAAFTMIGVLFMWVPLFAVNWFQATGLAELFGGFDADRARALELFVRPWVMIDLWAIAVLLTYYIVTSRNKGAIEVCAQFPENPIGLLAICVLFLAAKGVDSVVKAALPGQQQQKGKARSGGSSLPGGNWLWTSAAVGMFVFWILLLYNHGPNATREITNLHDFNHALAVVLPLTNQKLREKLPHSIGSCEDLWQQRVGSEEDAFALSKVEFLKSCKDKAFPPYKKHSLLITARWVTGLNSLEFTDIQVNAPSNVSVSTEQWDVVVSGRFNDLHLWLKVNWGQHELINDYMCCQNPFHFSLRASANCTPGEGFQGVGIEVGHVDKIEWVQHARNIMPGDSPDMETMVEVNYGSISAVEDALRNVITMKTGHLVIKNPDGSVENPLLSVGDVLDDVVRLNTGHRCVHQS